MNGKWSVVGEESFVYESGFLNVATAPTKTSDGTEIAHHFVRVGDGGAGVVLHDLDKGILMIWRHRVIGDAWGWEIPGGRIEAGETPRDAAVR